MANLGNWVPRGLTVPDGNAQRLQNQLNALVLNLQQTQALTLLLTNTMAQMVNNTTDYTGVESYFGVPTGKGQQLSAALGTVNTAILSANIQNFLQNFA